MILRNKQKKALKLIKEILHAFGLVLWKLISIGRGVARWIEIDQKAHNEPHNQEKKKVNWFFMSGRTMLKPPFC